MKLFSKSNNAPSNFITPQGFTITLATKNGLPQYYGPGSIIQGQVQLDLSKPITSPCQLRVIFACHQTIVKTKTDSQEQEDGDEPSSPLFKVEHLLLDNQILPACKRQGAFHFSIKLPLCSYPPSFEDGQRTVMYTIQSQLCFETDPGNVASRASVLSFPIKVMYLPLVPNVVPTSARTAPSSSVMSSYGSTSTPTFETSTQIALETPTPTPTPTSPLDTINASIKCKVGVCIGEFVSMTLKVENQSHTDLHSIHLSLVRQISYASSTQPPYTYTSPESTTVNTAIIPIAKPNNAGSSWNQQLQFIIPTNLGLTPSISTAITPLFKVDYFVLVSIPIPQRRNSIVSRLINKKRSLSIFNSASSSIAETSLPGQAQTQQPTEKILPTKGPSAIQFTPIPIVVGTISPHNCHRRFKWPIPNYLEVTDGPTFVRDKFEEDMIKHLAGLESLIMEEDDDDNIDSLIYTAMGSGSSGESDDDDDPMQSRIPARFRSNSRVTPASGLGTPPPSPPQYVASIADDAQSVRSITESFGIDRNMYGAPSGHRSLGLGRSLLVARHHIKMQ